MPLFTHVCGYQYHSCGSMLRGLLVRYRNFWCSLPKHCPPLAVCYRNFAEISHAAASPQREQTNPQRYNPNKIWYAYLYIKYRGAATCGVVEIVVYFFILFHPRSRAGSSNHMFTGTVDDQWLLNLPLSCVHTCKIMTCTWEILVVSSYAVFLLLWITGKLFSPILFSIVDVYQSWTIVWPRYRKTSSISRTKFQNLNFSCPLLQLSVPNPLKPGVQLRMKM